MANLQPQTDVSKTPPEGFFESLSKLISTNAADAAYRLAPGEFLFEQMFESLLASHKTGTINDRRLVLQKAIETMANMKPGSEKSRRYNKIFVSLLHDHKRRSNILQAQNLGGTQRYAFSRIKKETAHPQDQHAPQVQNLYDRLLNSGSNMAQTESSSISGLCYALGNILYLTLSRPWISSPDYNETSPYLDLSPLYGPTKEAEKTIRDIDGLGRGFLRPDCYFENRPVWLTPAVCALLILFNRNHNYIARRLLANNEEDQFAASKNLSMDARDDKVFSMARSINCVQFKNIIVEDFLKGLLGRHNVSPNAHIDLTYDLLAHGQGSGHHTALEFSFLYYWPVLMSEIDERWLQQNFFARRDVGETNDDNPTCPRYAQPPLIRDPTSGQFDDLGLAEILISATESKRAHSKPECIQAIEIELIEQARKMKICTLNEFREYLGLKRFDSFEEWNPDSSVAREAKTLYKSIDDLELYPGLQSEDTMPLPGFPLGYTQTFGLLVDIVTSIRSDPRFTTDYKPQILTAWGIEFCSPKPDNGAFGTMLSGLLLRNLPRHYPFNNIYALFPLTTPEETVIKLKEIPDCKLYDMAKPAVKKIHVVDTLEVIKEVLNDFKNFETPYNDDLKQLTNGYGYMLGFDNEQLHDADQYMTLYALMPDTRSFQQYSKYFRETAQQLIEKKSDVKSSLKTIDIIRDVINPTLTSWVCKTICDRDIPLDSPELHGQFDQFATLYAFIFRKFDPVDGWSVRQAALKESEKLNNDIKKTLKLVFEPPYETGIPSYVKPFLDFISRIAREMSSGHDLKDHSNRTFMERLVTTNDTVGRFSHIVRLDEYKNLLSLHGTHDGLESMSDEQAVKSKEGFKELRLIANVMGLCVVLSVNYAQVCSQAVEFYLDASRDEEMKEIIKLIKDDKPESDRKIMGYIREAQRLGQPFGLHRVAKDDYNGKSPALTQLGIKKGNILFTDFGTAHYNVDEKVKPDRKTPSIQGLGLHRCPGLSLVDNTMPAFFKVIFGLEGLKLHEEKDKGGLRTFSSYTRPENSDPRIFIDSTGKSTPYPPSLMIQYKEAPNPESKWPNPYVPLWRRTVEFLSSLLVTLTILRMIYSYLFASASRPAEIMVQMSGALCHEPTTMFQRWAINTIIPDLDGQPIPIEYTTDREKAHRLSIVDIDARDMQLEVYVDGVSSGFTTDFYLDKSVNCGEDVTTCLHQNFSGGVVVVPPGRHTVKIAWVGKEFVPGTEDIDWGDDDTGRRLKWQLESCF